MLAGINERHSAPNFLWSFATRYVCTQQGDIDVIAYVEAYLEVLTALGDAENDLYSANFADYAGGGGTKVGTRPLHRLSGFGCRPLRTVRYGGKQPVNYTIRTNLLPLS